MIVQLYCFEFFFIRIEILSVNMEKYMGSNKKGYNIVTEETSG